MPESQIGRLQGKSALVTGGRQGIGRAIVDRFVNEGARVMTCGSGPRPDDLSELVIWQTSDVSNLSDVKKLKSTFESELGPMSVLVNNAGVQLEKTITETSDEDWDSIIGINAKSVFLICRECIPDMVRGGSIINIGSISANTADPGLALYYASKAFVQTSLRNFNVPISILVPQKFVHLATSCPKLIVLDIRSYTSDEFMALRYNVSLWK